MRILVVDDNEASVAIITQALNKLRHEVVAVSSGQAAIESYLKKRPDLIILDVLMDGMNGFECARKIRKIDMNDWIPIIFLSSATDDKSIAKGIDAGGDDYLTKPFSEITLAAKIRAMERISALRESLYETTRNLYLLSSTDALTRIANRLQFEINLEEAVSDANKSNQSVAMFYIDLDNFKHINDIFGHQIGDLYLVETAARLKSVLGPADFLARLGGDEFAIVVPIVESFEAISNMAEKILQSLSKNFQVQGHDIGGGACIGIAFYPDAKDKETLVKDADIAMYHAKSTGRNNYQFFSDEFNKEYRHKMRIERSLRLAIERKELEMFYQPILNLKTGEVEGLEALIRWDHPVHGEISPDIFIPIAEESGLIHSVGDWVLSKAFEQASQWSLHEFMKFRFSINISPRQIHKKDFYENFTNLIKKLNIPTSHLCIELTETAFMAYNSKTFNDTLRRLHETGIHISIDDFGTGYSSLIRLKHIPVSALKIEKQFVQDALQSDQVSTIVTHLISLGRNLGINVIAEGIETKEQLNYLIEQGCELGQGYYLSKPMNGKHILEYLKSKK